MVIEEKGTENTYSTHYNTIASRSIILGADSDSITSLELGASVFEGVCGYLSRLAMSW